MSTLNARNADMRFENMQKKKKKKKKKKIGIALRIISWTISFVVKVNKNANDICKELKQVPMKACQGKRWKLVTIG